MSPSVTTASSDSGRTPARMRVAACVAAPLARPMSCTRSARLGKTTRSWPGTRPTPPREIKPNSTPSWRRSRSGRRVQSGRAASAAGPGDGVVAVLVLQPRGAVDQGAGSLDLGRHVGDHECDPLERPDRAAELLPLLAVGRGGLVCTLGEAEGHGRDRDPPAVEDLEEDPEPLADASEQVVGRDPGVIEDQLAGRRGVEAHLVLEPADREAGG